VIDGNENGKREAKGLPPQAGKAIVPAGNDLRILDISTGIGL
jgi:hypothetical protein